MEKGLIEGLSNLSNCQKRITVCVLFDKENRPAGFGYNFCSPPLGKCARLGMRQDRDAYTGDECETIHAEIMALRTTHPKRLPVAAVLYGHDWPCLKCEDALRSAGVTSIQVLQSEYTGLKCKQSAA